MERQLKQICSYLLHPIHNLKLLGGYHGTGRFKQPKGFHAVNKIRRYIGQVTGNMCMFCYMRNMFLNESILLTVTVNVVLASYTLVFSDFVVAGISVKSSQTYFHNKHLFLGSKQTKKNTLNCDSKIIAGINLRVLPACNRK